MEVCSIYQGNQITNSDNLPYNCPQIESPRSYKTSLNLILQPQHKDVTEKRENLRENSPQLDSSDRTSSRRRRLVSGLSLDMTLLSESSATSSDQASIHSPPDVKPSESPVVLSSNGYHHTRKSSRTLDGQTENKSNTPRQPKTDVEANGYVHNSRTPLKKNLSYPLENRTLPHPLENGTLPRRLENETLSHLLENRTLPHPLEIRTLPHPSENGTLPYPLGSRTTSANGHFDNLARTHSNEHYQRHQTHIKSSSHAQKVSPISPAMAPNWKYGQAIFESLKSPSEYKNLDLSESSNIPTKGSPDLNSDSDVLSPLSRSFGVSSGGPFRRDVKPQVKRELTRSRTVSNDLSDKDKPLNRRGHFPSIGSAPCDLPHMTNSKHQNGYLQPQKSTAGSPKISESFASPVRRYHATNGSIGSMNSSCSSDIKTEPSTPTTDIDELGPPVGFKNFRGRSNSEPNILEVDSDSDIDNDDHGFLSIKLKPSRDVVDKQMSGFSAMQKSSSPLSNKGASPGNSQTSGKGILPKRWRRSKTSSASKAQAEWKPQGSPNTWSNTTGSEVTLQPISLLKLTDAERVVLQKLTLAKLQAMNLGCAVAIPKEWCHKRSRRSGFSLKRRTGSSSLLENLREKAGKDAKDPENWVFGIPIGKVIANDLELRRRRPSMLRERRESADVNRGPRKSTSSSGSDSLSEVDQQMGGSSLLDALSLSSSAQIPETQSLSDRERSFIVHSPKVPYIVNMCCKHLETYGLQTLGIFRIGSSKKRSKQLRDYFASGRYIKLNEEHNPHDVGALLKEFFRDLTDPLLTRDLYSAFISSRKVAVEAERLHLLHLIISLLPPSNRDTLCFLLKFLALVARHSNDSLDQNGQHLPGNKMDAHNLATLFGPNLLHKAKGGEYQVESLERAEERKDIIEIIKEMINHHEAIFQLSGGSQDEILHALRETDVEGVDRLLNQRLAAARPSVQRMDVDTDLPDITIDNDSSHNDNVFLQTSRPRPSRGDPRGPRHREVPDSLSVPQVTWQRSDRSLSTSSPRVSPCPKAMKSATPDLPRVRSSTNPDPSSRTTQALVSPRPRMRSKSPSPGGGPMVVTQSSGGQIPSKHLLSVPTGPRGKHTSSSSILSSGSSRSGTSSPSLPDQSQSAHQSWFLETPPESPRYKTPSDGSFMQDATTVHPTSSKQRPLGIQVGPRSQEHDQWKLWEQSATERGKDFHEQETLV